MGVNQKDMRIISVTLRYFACILAVVFVVRGVVRLVVPGKKTPQAVEPVAAEKNGESGNGSSWVDQVIASDDEPEKLPQAVMSVAVDYSGLDANRKRMLDYAKTFLGTPYKLGGADRNGMDCSGFVFEVAREIGVKLPKSSREMFVSETVKAVAKEEMLPGDIVFFMRDGSIFHVALYMGGGNLIHSISDGNETGVLISSLDEPYWAEHYYSSGRIIH